MRDFLCGLSMRAALVGDLGQSLAAVGVLLAAGAAAALYPRRKG